jgi:hypothetical protein
MWSSFVRFAAASCVLVAGPVAAQECAISPPSATTGKLEQLAQDVARTNPCTTVPGLKARSIKSVWAAFTSSGRTGGKRFETVPPPGTPTGRVLLTDAGVAFDLSSVAAEGVQSLEIRSRQQIVARTAGRPGTAFTVPRERLTPGETYHWLLRTGSNMYRGSFELPPADEAAQVQSQLEAIANSGLDDRLRLLYRAAVFDEAEFYSARDEALATLRTLTSP